MALVLPLFVALWFLIISLTSVFLAAQEAAESARTQSAERRTQDRHHGNAMSLSAALPDVAESQVKVRSGYFINQIAHARSADISDTLDHRQVDLNRVMNWQHGSRLAGSEIGNRLTAATAELTSIESLLSGSVDQIVRLVTSGGSTFGSLLGTFEDAQKQFKDKHSELEALAETKRIELTQMIERFQQEVKQWESTITELQKEQAELQKSLDQDDLTDEEKDSLKDKIQQLNMDIAKHQKTIGNLNAEISKKRQLVSFQITP